MDLRQLKHIMKEFEKSSLHKMEITEKDFTVKLEKPSFNDVNNGQGKVVVKETHNDNREIKEISEQINNNVLVKAPLVGVFYEAPSPDSDPFVRINQKVNKGDVICIIEAMKVMNEITSPVTGIVKKIHVENANMVEFGQIVMEIEE